MLRFGQKGLPAALILRTRNDKSVIEKSFCDRRVQAKTVSSERRLIHRFAWKIQAAPYGQTGFVTKSGHRMHRLRSLLSALKPTRLGVLFAVLIGVSVGFWQWRRPPQPRAVLENLSYGHRAYFSPDGEILAIIHLDPESDKNFFLTTLWDVNTATKKHSLCKGEMPLTVVFAPDGETLACRFANQIKLWDVPTGRELATYFLPDGQNHPQLVFSPEGNLLALKEDYVLWDVTNKRPVKKLAQQGERKTAEGDHSILVLFQGKVVKTWDLATATLVAENRDFPILNFPPRFRGVAFSISLSSDRRFLIGHNPMAGITFVQDLGNGQKKELEAHFGDLIEKVALAPDGKMVALGAVNVIGPPQKSWWKQFTEWLGLQSKRSVRSVILQAFPSGEEITVLPNCSSPVFSPDGRTLAVTSFDGDSLQLWDLPIRKPIGKILSLAGVAAVATLLALGGLGWLRRRRCSGQRANQSSPGTDHDRLEHQAQ
jgi:WD40 repeat protein